MTASLILAIIALAISTASVTWQIAAWQLNGPRVHVDARQSIMLPQGPDTIAVTATNRGRAPTVITRLTLRTPDKGTMAELADPLAEINPRLPATLEPGASITMFYMRDRLTRSLSERNLDLTDVRAMAVTGHGVSLGRRPRPGRRQS